MEISSIRDWIQGQNLIEKAKNQTDPEKYFPVKLWQVSTNITVETELVAAAPIKFWQSLVQSLLNKNHVLLRLLFECGSYKDGATNSVFKVIHNGLWKQLISFL